MLLPQVARHLLSLRFQGMVSITLREEKLGYSHCDTMHGANYADD